MEKIEEVTEDEKKDETSEVQKEVKKGYYVTMSGEELPEGYYRATNGEVLKSRKPGTLSRRGLG